VRGHELLQRPAPDLAGDGRGVGGVGVEQRIRDGTVRLAAVLLPADEQPGPAQAGSSSGMSQTVSASGMRSRSPSVRGTPSSTVKANCPPGASAREISRSSASFSGNARMVSSRSTTSNGPAGTGGIRETSKRQSRSRARSRAMPMALELESTPR
jgi:hypothetical protein